MDLWQMVMAEHANIQELCQEVLEATGHGPNSRAELFADLRDEVERHIHVKENVLYPALEDDERTHGYLDELEHEHDEILDHLHALAARRDKNSHEWAQDFKEFASIVRHAFMLEENGVLVMARSALDPKEARSLMRAYTREKVAAYEASRWHLPQSMMPSRYGLPTGTVFGLLAGAAALGAAAMGWRMSQPRHRRESPLRPVHHRPEPPFPLQSGRIDRSLERSGSASGREGEARSQQETRARAAAAGSSSEDHWFSSAQPPRSPSGIASGLQPGGVVPGGGPAASAGSVGTGGAPTQNRETGSLRRDGK